MSTTIHFRPERLIERRKSKGIRANVLAQACGITPVQMSRIEHGSRGITVDMLVKVATLLECSTDWLLGLPDRTD